MRHRDEIDGLRAIAVLPIVLFHAGIDQIQGGFTGVDIFFVISGFLITSIITRELDDNIFNVGEFYRRRIVRIFPALFAMIAVVLLIGCSMLLVPELRTLGYSALSVLTFTSNLYFLEHTGYFGPAAGSTILLHTWSLGVEEQFYLLFPILMLAIRRFAPARSVAILFAIGAASFLLGLGLHDHPGAAFYILPTRVWELVCGSLVALGAYPALDAKRLRTLGAVGGLLLIVAGLAKIRGYFLMPSPWGLFPCLGAAAVIAYSRDTVVARMLSVSPMRFIGKISYSLYLWHWPVIVLYRLQTGDSLTIGESAGLVGLSIVLATISYYLIERPALRRFRSGRPGPKVWFGGSAIAAGALVSFAVAANAERILQLDPRVSRIAAFADYPTTAAWRYQFREGTCLQSATSTYDPRQCFVRSPGKRNVVVIGDSFGAHVWRAFALRYPEYNVIQANSNGCRPLVPYVGRKQCTALLRYVVEQELPAGGIDTVIVAAHWKPEDLKRLPATIALLKKSVREVVVVGPIAIYDGDFAVTLARDMAAGDPQRVRDRLDPQRGEFDAAMATVVARSGAKYLSPYRAECPGGRCQLLTPDGQPIHFDSAHFTLSGARLIVSRLPPI